MSNTGDRSHLSTVENTFNLGPTAFGLDLQHPMHFDVGDHVDAEHVDVSSLFHGDINLPHIDASPHVDVAVPPKLQFPNFLNNFHDDEGWWALTWIKTYDLTRDPQYLNMAVTIFGDMAAGWDNVFNGGIYWAKDQKDVAQAPARVSLLPFTGPMPHLTGCPFWSVGSAISSAATFAR